MAFLFLLVASFVTSFKVILQYCTAHPLLRTILHVISMRALKMAAFSLRLDLAMEVNRHFFENKCGDL